MYNHVMKTCGGSTTRLKKASQCLTPITQPKQLNLEMVFCEKGPKKLGWKWYDI